MSNGKKEKTALNVSAPTDTEQSYLNNLNYSIAENDEEVNLLAKMNEEVFQEMHPYYLKTVSMNDLYGNIYQGKPPIIDGLLYPGVYLFAGAPKLGKSFFMAQLAYHVSMGIPLWNYSVHKGTVLYLALEDDYKRLQKRLYRMFGTECAENLYFSVSASQMNSGLDKQISGFVAKHSGTTLIIIDTLQKIRESGKEACNYASDYEIITKLKNIANEYGLCLLLVHHTRKQSADDKFDMISGTNGLLGSADGAFIMQKAVRTSNIATLEISGRDQQDQKLTLSRNTDTLGWELESSETELWKEPPDPLIDAVAELITEKNTSWSGTPTELTKVLGVDIKANVLTMKLNVSAEKLLNSYGIRYENKRNHNGRQVTFTLCNLKE